MRFAKRVFLIAGVWGFLIVTPLYFMFDYVGRQYPPPMSHPDYYYGFLGVTIAWQLAFLLISTDPIRFRPLMVASMVEKFTYVAALAALYASGRLVFGQFAPAIPDAALGTLFVAAFVKTRHVGQNAPV